MFKIFFKETVLLLILVLTSKSIFAETIVDTVFVDPLLDGSIYYDWNDNYYAGSSGASLLEIGDYGFWGVSTHRSYLTFHLPEPREEMNIENVSCYMYLIRSIGNESEGTFPTWDTIPPPEENGGIIDHIVYGDTLYVEDWTAGDPGDPQTLQSNASIFTQGDPYSGWKNFEITESVIDDYANDRGRSQFRMRFEVENDFDLMDDFMNFVSGDCSTHIMDARPYIILTWSDEVDTTNDCENTPSLVQTFPNPFNKNICIKSTSKNSKIDVEVYNLKGQKIISKHNLSGSDELKLNFENKPSGIYLLKISDGVKTTTKKITYLK